MDGQWFRELGSWRDFYVFAGTAAATLLGLMFVVASLSQRIVSTDEGSTASRAFSAPVITFFVTAIVVSMVMLVPRPSPKALAVLLAIIGLGGFLYMINSGAHKQWRERGLGLDDLAWYVALPFLAYAVVAAAAVEVWSAARYGFYLSAAAMLLLLLIGIRNAWDIVTFIAQQPDT